MKGNRKTIQVLVILTIIFTIMGGSLAYWNWSSLEEQQTNVVFTIKKDFSCAADGGGNITSSDVSLAPTSCTDATRAIKRKVIVTPTLDRDNLTVSLDLWLTIDELGEGLKKSNNFRYVLTTSATSCEEGEIISEGNFKGRKPGDKIRLITNDLHTVTPTPEEYYLYIWLDSEETSASTMNQRFSMSLGGVCDEVETLVGDAYAIYSESDKSLTFVRSETPITAGSTYDGKVSTEVYENIENTLYSGYDETPWYEYLEQGVIKSINFKDIIRPISSAGWFYKLGSSLTITNINYLDVSNVINMSFMFARAVVNSNILSYVSSMDTSNVTDMSYMLSMIYGFDSLDLSNFDTSNVTDMSSMFAWSSVTTIDGLSAWDTSKVTNMSEMFTENGLGELFGIEDWNTSNVTNMSAIFRRSNITSLDLSGWDTSCVTNMNGTFAWSNIKDVGDISIWDTSNVTDMSYMFDYVTLTDTLDLSSWNVSKVTSYDDFNSNSNNNIKSPKFGA